MFYFTGWLVTTGFALYGLANFLRDHVVANKREIV